MKYYVSFDVIKNYSKIVEANNAEEAEDVVRMMDDDELTYPDGGELYVTDIEEYEE